MLCIEVGSERWAYGLDFAVHWQHCWQGTELAFGFPLPYPHDEDLQQASGLPNTRQCKPTEPLSSWPKPPMIASVTRNTSGAGE